MPYPRRGAWPYIRANLVSFCFLSLVGFPTTSLAHEGHDHGAPEPAAVTTSNPRVVAQSEAYEIVGILRGERLHIYLDRFATNAPVTDAIITAVIGGDQEIASEKAPDGTYRLASDKFAGEGPLEIIFSVNAPTGEDLLVGTLQLPSKRLAAAPNPTRAGLGQMLERVPVLRVGSLEVTRPYVIAAVALALGFLLGVAIRSGRKIIPATALAIIAVLISAAYALGHEGDDHEEAKASTPTGDTPRRIPDGTVFLPKPSQRLLAIRTILTRSEQAQKAIDLIGRVIADPNRSGLVQSIAGGRIVAPEQGLPRLGQSVRKGDVLALVEQAVPQADRTTISEKVGEIEQQIAIAETKLKRMRQLLERGITPASQVVDAETELEGLRRRRDIVRQIRVEPEILRAPIDGVIAAARVVAGQVVQAQDVLFQIVDPKGLWVEALVYGEADPAKLTAATAKTADGTALTLVFQGFSRALQQQATVVQFAVENPPENLAVGQPVTVVARNGDPGAGVILARDAVVRANNGEQIVWCHTGPERFEARPVRVESFDAARVLVRAGIGEGERVVTRGAELINQIR